MKKKRREIEGREKGAEGKRMGREGRRDHGFKPTPLNFDLGLRPKA